MLDPPGSAERSHRGGHRAPAYEGEGRQLQRRHTTGGSAKNLDTSGPPQHQHHRASTGLGSLQPFSKTKAAQYGAAHGWRRHVCSVSTLRGSLAQAGPPCAADGPAGLKRTHAKLPRDQLGNAHVGVFRHAPCMQGLSGLLWEQSQPWEGTAVLTQATLAKRGRMSSRHLDARQLGALPWSLYGGAAWGGGREDTCRICLDGFEDHQEIRILPCNHIFHRPCLDPWLTGRSSSELCHTNLCPICKAPLGKIAAPQVRAAAVTPPPRRAQRSQSLSEADIPGESFSRLGALMLSSPGLCRSNGPEPGMHSYSLPSMTSIPANFATCQDEEDADNSDGSDMDGNFQNLDFTTIKFNEDDEPIFECSDCEEVEDHPPTQAADSYACQTGRRHHRKGPLKHGGHAPFPPRDECWAQQ